MADESPVSVAGGWPLPKFNFQVQFGDAVMHCQEVSGFDLGSRIIEARRGDSPTRSATELPSSSKYTMVTLKKCLIEGGMQCWDWFNQMKGSDERTNVTICLLDEASKPARSWTLANAWPTKIAGNDLMEDGNKVAVETIELACEGLTFEDDRVGS